MKYPLSFADCTNGKYMIVTAQGNHYAETYDPAAASMIVGGPKLMDALKQIERLSREADGSLVDVRAMLGDIARTAIATVAA